MTNDSILLSNGTDSLATFILNIGGTDLHVHKTGTTDPESGLVARVLDEDPAGDEAALLTRNIPYGTQRVELATEDGPAVTTSGEDGRGALATQDPEGRDSLAELLIVATQIRDMLFEKFGR